MKNELEYCCNCVDACDYWDIDATELAHITGFTNDETTDSHDKEVVDFLSLKELSFELPSLFVKREIMVFRSKETPYLVIIWDVKKDIHYYYNDEVAYDRWNKEQKVTA